MHTDSPLTYPCEILNFRLGAEEYGINIMKVQELRTYENVTMIANAPDFVKGVVNLRGVIVPIIDMRIRFNTGETAYDEFTVVVILNIRKRIIGMVVDSVSDVVTLEEGQVRPAPEMGTTVDTNHLLGIGTVDDRMLMLLDIDQLLSLSEMGLFDKMAA